MENNRRSNRYVAQLCDYSGTVITRIESQEKFTYNYEKLANCQLQRSREGCVLNEKLYLHLHAEKAVPEIKAKVLDAEGT